MKSTTSTLAHHPLRLVIAAFALAWCAVAQAADYSGTLPVIYIDTENNTPITSKETYLKATYYIDALGLSGYESLGSADQPLTMQIRGRGNWTWKDFDKKPYRLKLDTKESPLGLDANKHFALLAHADDCQGFLRNPMGFWISKTIGMPWTPAEQPVELVLNGDYRGLYFLTETIRVDKDRVNIDKQSDLATDPYEITGGWLVEIDNYYDDPHILIREGDGADIVFTYKSPEELSQAQADYLTQQMTAINGMVYNTDRADCQWAQMVDLGILAKFYVVQEIMDNYESFHGSCYLYKQRGEQEKWVFGPVWDFGSSFNYDKSQWVYQGREHHMTWIGQMCQFPEFMDVVKTTWRDFYDNHYQQMLDYAQSYADRIAKAAVADAKRWPQYGNADEQQKCDKVIKRLRLACAWLAKQWGGDQPPSLSQPITVYFIDNSPNPWSEVYAYSWDNGQDGFYEMFGRWPGEPMTPTMLNGQSAFVISKEPEHELSDWTGLIFDNGHSGSGNQTADLKLVNNAVYYPDGSYTGIHDAASTQITIIKKGLGIEITTTTATSLPITTIDGRHRIIELPTGTTYMPLPRGLYLIGKSKLAI